MGRISGRRLTLAPDARLDDHRFDVQVFTALRQVRAVRHLLSIAGGRRVYNPKVQSVPGPHRGGEPRKPMMAHADSQPLATTPARFEVRAVAPWR